MVCCGFTTRSFGFVRGRITLQKGSLKGLSSIHRTGNVALEFRHNTVSAGVQLATKRLDGSVDYKANLLLWPLSGKLRFKVSY